MRAYLLSRLRLQRRSLIGTGLSIALSVAFVVVVLGATSTLKDFVAAAAAPRARAATLVVTADPRVAVSPEQAQVRAIRAVPGVAAVATTGGVTLRLTWPDGVRPTFVETAAPDPRMAWYDVVDGREPTAAGEVLVDRRTANDIGLRVGSRIGVTGQDGRRQPAEVVVAGLVRFDGPQTFDHAVLARGQDVLAWGTDPGPDGAATSVEEIQVLAAPGTDVEALTRSVAAVAPDLLVQPAQDAVDAAVLRQTQDVDVIGRLFLGFTLVATGVATIVIANTFTILVAQRSRELALLRCIGATRRQLRRATRIEAAILGVVASVIGSVTGAAVLVVGVFVAARTFGVLEGLRPVIGVADVVLPVLLGLAVTLGASAMPTRRATRVAPLAALRPATEAQARRTNRTRIVAGALVALLGSALVAAGLAMGGNGDSGVAVLAAAAGGLLIVLGVVLVSPVLVPAVTRVLGVPVAKFGPVARIAVGSTRRDATRSAATSTALFVGVCLISVITVGAATTVRAGQNGLAEARPLDVALMTLSQGDLVPKGLPAGMVGEVGKVRGITEVTGLRGVRVGIGATPAAAKKELAAAGRDASTGVLGGDPATLQAAYRATLPLTDEVLLVPDTSVPDGVTDGGPVTLAADRTTVTLTAVILPSLPAMLVSGRTLDRLGAGDAVLSLWARAGESADPAVVTAGITEVARAEGLVTLADATPGQSGVGAFDYLDAGALAERASLLSVMEILLRIATGLLAVALVISLVGIANTLSLSVLERSRESAVSRAIGMTRRQLRTGLAIEAALLALVGSLLGVVVGAALGWAGAVALTAGFATVDAPVVPLGRIGLIVGVCLLAAVLASLLPGRRAARVSPTRALAES